MICPNCNTENRRNAKFCDECGFELPTVAPVAREIFGGADGMESADTVDLSRETVRLDGGEASPTAGIDRMNDSSYSPDDAGSDITRAFAASAPAQGARSYIAPGPAAPQPARPAPSFAQAGPLSSADVSAQTGSAADGAKAPARAGRALRVGLVAVLCAIALAAAVAGITYSLELWGGRVVADVTGMEAAEATVSLTEDGFLVERSLVRSDEVEGIVLATDPAPGARVPEGSTVTISVSTPRIVPSIVGAPRAEAERMLAEEEFVNVEYVEKKSDAAEGTVLAASPEPGTRSKADSKITVTLAVPYRVPNVEGLSQEEAAAVLAAEGYVARAAYVYDEDVEEGRVTGTDPAPASPLASGSEVTVNVAKHRSSELVALTREWLKGSPRLSIGGVSYELSEVKSVSYAGGSACSYTVVARPYETHSWFGVESETRYGNYENVTGTISWTDDDKIASTDPALKRI